MLLAFYDFPAEVAAATIHLRTTNPIESILPEVIAGVPFSDGIKLQVATV